jgi:hypothetical protein
MRLNGVEIDGSEPEQESWWGPKAIIVYDGEPGRLLVRVTKRKRKGDLAVICCLLAVGLLCLVFAASRMIGGILCVSFFIALIGWYRMTSTVLTVTEAGFAAQFSGRFLRRRARVTWEEVGTLTYRTQTKNRPEGLFAKRSFFSSTCLIPDIDKTLTVEVIEKIYALFPQRQPSR